MSSQSKSKKRKKTKISFFRLIFFIIVFVLMCRVIYSLFVHHPQTKIVKYGNIELSVSTTGYIIRDETIVQSPATGKILKLVSEGTRVKKGVNIASIIKSNYVKKYRSKIKELNKEIAQIKANSKTNNLFENDVEKLNLQIQEQFNKVEQVSNSGNINKLPQIKEQINSLIKKKQKVTGELGFSTENLQRKKEKKEEYVSRMNSSKVDITTSVPGILSFDIDGYEKILSPQNIKKLTVKDIQKLEIKDKKNNNSKQAIARQPLVKIINNFEWYIVCIINNENLKHMNVNNSVKISVNDKTMPAKIDYIKKRDNGKSLVSFLLTSNLKDFYNKRKIKVKIIKQKYKGIKIPTSAIIYKNNKRGVLIVDEGITKFKEVELVGFNKEYAIVETQNKFCNTKGLSLYDKIITNPLYVKEGVLIR